MERGKSLVFFFKFCFTLLQLPMLTRSNYSAAVLDKRDVGYILDEIWHGYSVVSRSTDKVTLTRWDRKKPLGLDNAVCMTKAEAVKHEEEELGVPSEQRYSKGKYNG